MLNNLNFFDSINMKLIFPTKFQSINKKLIVNIHLSGQINYEHYFISFYPHKNFIKMMNKDINTNVFKCLKVF